MKRKVSPGSQAAFHASVSLNDLKVVLLTELPDQRRVQSLLHKHHYLVILKPVGERMFYAPVDAQRRWQAVLIFSAAAKHLKYRDQWIGWTQAQRDRRLSLVANNTRFLILPEARLLNLGSRMLRLALDRPSMRLAGPG